MRLARVDELTYDCGAEVACIWCYDLPCHALRHGFQKVFEPGIVPESEERDLCTHAAHPIEFCHGCLQGVGSGRVGED